MTIEQPNEEPKFEVNQPSRFKQLVEKLLSESYLFQFTPIRATLGGEHTAEEKRAMRDERVKIIEAIEKNELSLYLPSNADDKMLDAVHCLTAIHDELQKPKPDEDFIEQTVAQLKEYL